MLTLKDALERSGLPIVNVKSSYKQKIIVPEHVKKISPVIDKKSELMNALDIVQRMRASETERRKMEQARLDDIKNGSKLGEQVEESPIDAVKKAQELKREIAEQQKRSGIQLPVNEEKAAEVQKPQEKPQEKTSEKTPRVIKTDDEIKESIRKANELNMKLAPKIGSDISADDLMKSVLDELV